LESVKNIKTLKKQKADGDLMTYSSANLFIDHFESTFSVPSNNQMTFN